MKEIILLALNVYAALCAPPEDLITNLPGLPRWPSFKQYSGYLKASNTKRFHYWFVESQSNPSKDPLVLWLNGGPGCSSLDGLLSENGPIHVYDNGSLYSNPYSWNKIANIIYLESPAGVGFSYDIDRNFQTDDDKVATHNYNALLSFFKKYPELSKNPLFIIGESYGGVYVPTLTLKILQGSSNVNLKGFAVGNGLNSAPKNDISAIFFAYYHGIFGQSLQSGLREKCCNGGKWSMETCDFSYRFSHFECLNLVDEAHTLIYQSGLNNYALYLDCYGSKNGSAMRYEQDIKMLFRNLDSVLQPKRKEMSTQRLKLVPPCIDAEATTKWLNRIDVRKALHISSDRPVWSVCSDAVFINYRKIYTDVSEQYHQALKYKDLRVLVYNGDVDMVCNFLGDEWFVDDLKLPLTSERSPWYVEGQVAGFAKTFSKRLTYTTIRGAGHMVPQWAPAYAYAMFDKFINNKKFVE